MAWIGTVDSGKWIDTEDREIKIALHKEIVDELDYQYPTIDDLADSGYIQDYDVNITELKRLQRVSRCEGDLLEFALEYFSEGRNPGNPGNWDDFNIERAEDAPEFHKELTGIMNNVSTEEKNAKVVAAVARSHGKSSWLSKAFPVSEIVYRLRKFIIIISETPTVSTANMTWIRDQLKENKKLRGDFGPMLSPNDKNIVDNMEEFIAWSPGIDGYKEQRTSVQAASTGQALRGRTWSGSRPDLIIMDDLEDARAGGNASTPEQRSKLLQWLRSTVMPLGDSAGERTAFVMMGTTVHRESLLMHVIYERADFRARIYKALIEEPERMDLWENCREIYTDRNNTERALDARAYYDDNKEEMDKGAVVLWEEVQPIWRLMTWRWDNGSLAFNTEYQNNPIDEESMVFNVSTFEYWTDSNPAKTFNHKDFYISMGVDMAMGKERGDFSAVSVVAESKETGTIYVVDSFGKRIQVDEFIDAISDIVMKWEPDVIAVEAVAAQEFFADVLKNDLASKGYPSHSRLKKIYSKSRKELRIEALIPSIENKKLQFSRNHALLIEQFEGYGQGGGHDDLPDSLEMAISAIGKNSVIVKTVSRMNRW